MSNQPTSSLPAWHSLADFSLASQPDTDQRAWEQVAIAIAALPLPVAYLTQLKTAINEAVRQVIVPKTSASITIRVLASSAAVARPTLPQPPRSSPAPATQKAKLSTSPPGWGYFLVERPVEASQSSKEAATHIIELFIYREGAHSSESWR